MTAHLDDDLVLDYLRNRLPDHAKSAIRQHLLECAECREMTGEVARLLMIVEADVIDDEPADSETFECCEAELAGLLDNWRRRKQTCPLPLSPRRQTPARRKWLSRRVMIALALGLVAMTAVWFPEGRAEPRAWATVIEARPGVSIQRGDTLRAADSGEGLAADESLIVSSEASAQLSIAGLGSAEVGPETCLSYTASGNAVELSRGFVAFSAARQPKEKPFCVRTRQAEATIMGTRFNLAAFEERTALRVSEGLVRLTSLGNGQARAIRGGSRAIIAGNSPPVVGSSRSGSVLLLTSRSPQYAYWETFNQLLTEKLLGTRLWHLGFKVERRHYDEVNVADLQDRSVVIVSLFDFGGGEEVVKRIGLARHDTPVLCLEPAAYPVLGMTEEQRNVGFGFGGGASLVEFSNPRHSLAGGLVGKKRGIIRGVIGWGRPEGEAVRVAHIVNHPDRVVLFGYETGSQMADGIAPARRVGLFLDPSGISEHSSEAWTVFEAAVEWCVAMGNSPR